MGRVRGKTSIPKRKALHYLAAELRKGTSVAALHGRRYAEYVHHVRQVDLIQCAQMHQHLAVLTVLKSLPTFQAHQAIYVVDWAEVRLPGRGSNPDNPVILAIVGMRACGTTKDSKDSGDLLTVFRHVCLLKSKRASLDTMSHLRRCWPLHDPCFNVAMVIHATSRADGWVRRLSWPLRCLRSGNAGNSVGYTHSWHKGLSSHFGIDVADYFAWIAHYVNCLWFLGGVGFVFTIIRYNVEAEDYDYYVQPIFSIVLMLFVAAVIEVDDPFEKVVEAECFGAEQSSPSARSSSPPTSLFGSSPPRTPPLKGILVTPPSLQVNSLSPCSAPATDSPVKSATMTAESATLRQLPLVNGSGHQSGVRPETEAGANGVGCAGEAAEATVPAGPPADDPFGFQAKAASASDHSDSPETEQPHVQAAPHAGFGMEQPHTQAAPHAVFGMAKLSLQAASHVVLRMKQPDAQSNHEQMLGNRYVAAAQQASSAVQETAGAAGGELAGLAGGVADEINDLLRNMMDRPGEFSEMAGDVIDMWRGLYRPEEPFWMRWAKTFSLIPLMGLYFLAVQAVFVLLFWFEMWVIFSWGQCTRINEENGDEKCTTPVIYRGEWVGFLVEILPSVSEGILLELLLAVSKCMSAFVCDRQNWSTQSQYEFAYFIQCVLFEMSGKVGFVSVLAFVFVPDWWEPGGSCEGQLDYMIFGKHALSCIKTKVSYKLRRRLLVRSMKGPMLVSMLVAMLIKVILPRLITLMLRGGDTDLSILTALELREGSWCLCRVACGFCCSFWRCFWRLAGLIFLFDCEAVGGPLFVIRPLKPPKCGMRESTQDDGYMLPEGVPRILPCGDLHPHPAMPPAASHPLSSDPNEEETVKPVSTQISDWGVRPSIQDHYGTIQDAFYQGMRREFCVLDEYLEQLLHFTFFTFFGMVWPLGCTFALMNYLLEFRFDILKLGYVRRRSLPKPDQSLRRLIRVCTRIIAYVSIIIQVALMLLSFQQLQVWLPHRFAKRNLLQYKGEWMIVFVIMVIGMMILSWVCRWLVKRLRLWKKRRRLNTIAAQVQMGPTSSWGSHASESPRAATPGPSERTLAAVVPTPVPPWQY